MRRLVTVLFFAVLSSFETRSKGACRKKLALGRRAFSVEKDFLRSIIQNFHFSGETDWVAKLDFALYLVIYMVKQVMLLCNYAVSDLFSYCRNVPEFFTITSRISRSYQQP